MHPDQCACDSAASPTYRREQDVGGTQVLTESGHVRCGRTSRFSGLRKVMLPRADYCKFRQKTRRNKCQLTISRTSDGYVDEYLNNVAAVNETTGHKVGCTQEQAVERWGW